MESDSHKHADTLRRAVVDFDDEPLTFAAVDAFRLTVLAVADELGGPVSDSFARELFGGLVAVGREQFGVTA